MQVFQKILCPVDFSEFSTLALNYAHAFASENEAELIVYHSVPDLSPAMNYVDGNYLSTVNEVLTSGAKGRLEDYVSSNISEGPHSTLKIGLGNPPEAILDIAQREAVDLIVMGTHGYTGHEAYLVGSVTNRVLHKSAVPVLTVCRPRHSFLKEGKVEIKRILCPVDLELANARMIDLALCIARTYQSEIFFLYVVQDWEELNWMKQQQRWLSKLERLVNPEAEKWCIVKFLVEYGNAAEEIMNSVERHHIDLVVMGHHSRRSMEEFLLGSVARKVVMDSKCPVLVARSRSDSVY